MRDTLANLEDSLTVDEAEQFVTKYGYVYSAVHKTTTLSAQQQAGVSKMIDDMLDTIGPPESPEVKLVSDCIGSSKGSQCHMNAMREGEQVEVDSIRLEENQDKVALAGNVAAVGSSVMFGPAVGVIGKAAVGVADITTSVGTGGYKAYVLSGQQFRMPKRSRSCTVRKRPEF